MDAKGSAAQTATFTLTLTVEERATLLGILEQELKDEHVEARRTEDFEYREFVHKQEALLQSLVEKLRAK